MISSRPTLRSGRRSKRRSKRNGAVCCYSFLPSTVVVLAPTKNANITEKDHIFRTSLSPIARRACAIVARIRDHERRTIWTPELEESLASDPTGPAAGRTVFPGMMFSLAKERMEATTLWRIVRRMPKGALLRMFSSTSLLNPFVYLERDGH